MSESLNSKITFEDQFRDTRTIESFGGQAEITDITPEHPTSDVPILLAGGWSIGRKALKGVSREFYSHGCRNIVVDHARSGEIPEHDIYPSEVLQKATTLLAAMEAAGVEKADVVTQSAGALDTVVAASMSPERFRSLILVAPAGMIGDDKFSRLAARFVPKMARSYTRDLKDNPGSELAILSGATAYIGKNIGKAWREVNVIADTRIDTVLRDLRAAGINVAVLQSNRDSVFPPRRINSHVDLHETQGNVDAYASVAWEKAGHEELMIHPERTVLGVLQLIKQFEKHPSVHSPARELTLQ